MPVFIRCLYCMAIVLVVLSVVVFGRVLVYKYEEETFCDKNCQVLKFSGPATILFRFNCSLTMNATLITKCIMNKIEEERVKYPIQRIKTFALECTNSTKEITLIPEQLFQSFKGMHGVWLYGCQLSFKQNESLHGIVTLRNLTFKNTGNPLLSGDLFSEGFNLGILKIENNNIPTIKNTTFNGLNNLIILSLYNNSIQNIENGTFISIPNTTALVLSFNMLRAIYNGTFAGLLKLETLFLERNNIAHIDNSALNDLKHLVTLDVSSNYLTAVPSAIKLVPQLKVLYLDNNSIAQINKEELSGLTKLKILGLGSNIIEEIKQGTFEGIGNLTSLFLGYTALHVVPNGTFKGLRNLADLFLDGNKNISLNDNSLSELRNIRDDYRDAKSLPDLSNLSWLNMSHCGITEIPMQVYERLPTVRGVDLSFNELTSLPKIENYNELMYKNMHISVLFLNGNKISYIHGASIKYFHTLKIIGLSDNQITYIEPHSFVNMPLITVIDLSDNNLTEPNYATFQIRTNQFAETILKLNDNPLHCTCRTEWFKHGAKRTDLPDLKGIEHLRCLLQVPVFGSQKAYITSLPNREYYCHGTNWCHSSSCGCCVYRDNRTCPCMLTFDCPDRFECYVNNLGNLLILCKHNKSVLAVPKLPQLATMIVIQNNPILTLDIDSFPKYKSFLIVIDISFSNLENIVSRTFVNQEYLLTLKLNDNRLVNFEDHTFEGLERLETLWLHNNQISSISSGLFQHLKNLMELKLNNNYLKTISQIEIPYISYTTKIYISGNRWHCGCVGGQKFKEWLTVYLSERVLIDANNITCYTADPLMKDQQEPIIEMDFSVCRPNLKAINTGLATAAGIFVFAVLVTVIIYWKRKIIQVWLFGRFGFRFGSNEEDDGLEYDAFLSYCSDDQKYVKELVHTLERNPPHYQLCFHHRDWLGGACIDDNILNSVNKSRRTILLLSQNFLKSHWCYYEFQMVHLKVLALRKPYLIVVVIDDEVPEIKDAALKYYVDTHTYLKWDEPWFWRKLRYSLPHKNAPQNNLLNNECEMDAYEPGDM